MRKLTWVFVVTLALVVACAGPKPKGGGGGGGPKGGPKPKQGPPGGGPAGRGPVADDVDPGVGRGPNRLSPEEERRARDRAQREGNLSEGTPEGLGGNRSGQGFEDFNTPPRETLPGQEGIEGLPQQPGAGALPAVPILKGEQNGAAGSTGAAGTHGLDQNISRPTP